MHLSKLTLVKGGAMKALTGSLIMLLCVVFSGCSKSPEETVSERDFTKARKAVYANQDELISQINNTDDIFTLYAMKDEYRLRGGKSQAIKDALGKKWQQLLKESKQKAPINDNLDLVDFKWQRIYPKKYRIYWLFYVKEPIDKDCQIYVYGHVDANHVKLLDEVYQPYKYQNWTIWPIPPTSKWQKGEYVLVANDIPAKDIPYRISFNLFYKDKNGKGVQYGEFIKLGWFADAGE